MKRILLSVVILLYFASPSMAGGVNFIFSVQPLSVLWSPDIDGFIASNALYSEEISGSGSWMGTIGAGIGIDTAPVYLDFTLGLGYLWNTVFSAPLTRADFGAKFKLGKAITFGPHIGVIHFNELDWAEKAKLEFSDTNGAMVGFDFTAGRLINFIFSIDYLIGAEFDVEKTNGWTVTSNELDLSGFAIQMGINGRF